MKLSCSQCPFGTYSSVNTTSIIWNEDILKQFTNKCQINKNDKIISNKCEGFKLMTSENYTSVIAGGDLEFPDAIYSYQFVYNIELKQDGKVMSINCRLYLPIRRIPWPITMVSLIFMLIMI
jgi:hypothetical protein